ncbi:electron transfer flavoprotein beta subunit lysine methyltransferase isoform X2 [Elephas maximus indicus]|uniref:electron transfer flavoprotein beta subunit lysine methyltransferase isoform X2 n=1 Tax=Elephas maximus indicus TaxID=99487 RepID=UPI002115F1EE|nr:electron transfer flavoprotein beta subunit lysine methyltransferase isoform X2 [Elephas maximus indicus]
MALSLSWKVFALFPTNCCSLFLRAVRSSGLPSFPWGHCPWRGAGSILDPEMKAFLEENTEVTSSGSLTPEIQLRLLTPRCKFWYLLDNPDIVRGKSVLDLGSGCGATAIAAKMSGASRILANDIDPIAGMAITLNCELNQLNPFPILTKNILDLEQDKWDLVVLGDMFYDKDLADSLHRWLKKCFWTHTTQILIGDPGRPQFSGHSIQNQLHKVVEYSLPEPTRQENNGLTTSTVWDFQP